MNGLCSDRQRTISFGNMIPVDLAGCVLARIMEAWATFEHVALSSGMHSPFACADDESGDEQQPCFWTLGVALMDHAFNVEFPRWLHV